MVKSKYTYIEQHYFLSVSEFEGIWEMAFKSPFNSEERIHIYVVAPNSDYDSAKLKNYPIVTAGERLTDVFNKLLHRIEFYPFEWELSGEKLVSYGYDFVSDLTPDGTIRSFDLTEIAYQAVNEYYNFFYTIDSLIVGEEEKLSGNGVMAKLKITFDRSKHVNHLAIDYFTEYPIQLISLMYQEDEGADAVIELPLSKIVQTSRSIHLHFPVVYAKTFYLVIEQESYYLQNQTTDSESQNKIIAWKQATERSLSLYGTAVDEYLNNLVLTKDGVTLHQEVLDSYKNVSKKHIEPTHSVYEAYRSDFSDIKNTLDTHQH